MATYKYKVILVRVKGAREEVKDKEIMAYDDVDAFKVASQFAINGWGIYSIEKLG